MLSKFLCGATLKMLADPTNCSTPNLSMVREISEINVVIPFTKAFTNSRRRRRLNQFFLIDEKGRMPLASAAVLARQEPSPPHTHATRGAAATVPPSEVDCDGCNRWKRPNIQGARGSD